LQEGSGEDAGAGASPPERDGGRKDLSPTSQDAIRLGGFVYNVELHLPESRDPAVYEALFRALKTHLLS
jgi:hypothetical protein